MPRKLETATNSRRSNQSPKYDVIVRLAMLAEVTPPGLITSISLNWPLAGLFTQFMWLRCTPSSLPIQEHVSATHIRSPLLPFYFCFILARRLFSFQLFLLKPLETSLILSNSLLERITGKMLFDPGRSSICTKGQYVMLAAYIPGIISFKVCRTVEIPMKKVEARDISYRQSVTMWMIGQPCG
jgi:hypothetical protein